MDATMHALDQKATSGDTPGRWTSKGRAIAAVPRVLACLGVAAAACLGLLSAPSGSGAQTAAPLTNAMRIAAHGITVRYPANWSTEQYSNVQELMSVPAAQRATLDAAALNRLARIIVTIEPATDHAEAVRRLKDIAAERDAPTIFLEIGGWPALQRRYLAVKEAPGQAGEGGAGEEKGSVGRPVEMILRVDTAVAAGSLVVRLDARLPPDASPVLASEVEAIGRSPVFPTRGEPSRIKREIESLRRPVAPRSFRLPAPKAATLQPAPSTVQSSAPAGSGATPAQITLMSSGAGLSQAPGLAQRLTLGNPASEPEIAASTNGQNIVVGQQFRYTTSNDGGKTFSATGTFPGATGGDSSLAFGRSGAFYGANIKGNATGMSISTDNGVMFTATTNAYVCGSPGTCPAGFPDQQHIAADRFNAGAAGDRVYSVWRQLNGNYGIVCSSVGGTTWGTATFFGGDLPRITVGQDGFVYVVFQNGLNINLTKFTPCSATNATAPVAGFGTPKTVTTVTAGPSFPQYVVCPVPGLDRCNNGNNLSSMMVAVDDTDANHVYVAYAVATAAGNENVIVQDSIDGGMSWPGGPGRAVQVNAGITARRYMPWVCAVGGAAYVSWYDRRASTPAGNDLTDYFGGAASRDVTGNLVPGSEFQINALGSSDAQCAAGRTPGSAASWPCVPRAQADAEFCSVQPQLAGVCCNNGLPGCPGSQTRCDFSGPDATICPVGETCNANPLGGCPKYGDYNGNTCAAGRLYTIWASATPPPGTPPSGNIDLFFSSTLVCCTPQIQVPTNLALGSACVGSTTTTTLQVCNTGKADLRVDPITSSAPTFSVSPPSSGYPVVVGPDSCFPFTVSFTATAPGVATAAVTIPSNDPVNPSRTVQLSGTGTQPAIRVTGSADFGNVCAGSPVEKAVSVCNVGACSLNVTSVSLGTCSDFTLVGNPFPAPVIPGACFDVGIRFTPTSAGPKTCNLTVASTDPLTPTDTLTVTATTPPASIGTPAAQDFPATVVRSLGMCSAAKPFPISNTGLCNLTITNMTIGGPNPGDFALSGLPAFPIILQPGHVAGAGGLRTVFSPTALARERQGTFTVTYVSDPITGAPATVTRDLCGEGVRTGARVLVTAGGVPMPTVHEIELKRLGGTFGFSDEVDEVRNVPLQTVTPTPGTACAPLQFHREYGAVTHPPQLVPGVYRLKVEALVNGKERRHTISFSVDTCGFDGTIVIDF